MDYPRHLGIRVAEADSQMKEFLALSCGLTSPHRLGWERVEGRSGSSKMKGRNGEMELSRSGNCR